MGACVSEADRQSSIVNRELAEARKNSTKIKKLLFLGSGGSGKSTIFKQLKGIYGKGFNITERKRFVTHIHMQVISQMKLALDVLHSYINDSDELLRQNEKAYINDKHKRSENQEDDDQTLELSEDALEAEQFLHTVHCRSYTLNDEIVSALKCLWSEPAIQKMYEMRNITKIFDSSAYFWNKLDTLNTPGYVPDEADILLVRYRTTGTQEETYEMPGGEFSFLVTDVGGQQSERKKWIRCFDSVTAVLFIASLSCYDEVLFEDESTNSMEDQLVLFDDICNHNAFCKASIILFLNKKDLFKEKIKKISLTTCVSFSDYKGDPYSFDETTLHISNAFRSLNKNEKSVFTHITCATDQDNIQKVFVDVERTIIETSFIRAGMSFDEFSVTSCEIIYSEE